MIKVKVKKPFYCQIDKILYVDKERYEELANFGLVEKIEEYNDIDTQSLEDVVETGAIKNGKRKVLSKQSMEDSSEECVD